MPTTVVQPFNRTYGDSDYAQRLRRPHRLMGWGALMPAEQPITATIVQQPILTVSTIAPTTSTPTTESRYITPPMTLVPKEEIVTTAEPTPIPEEAPPEYEPGVVEPPPSEEVPEGPIIPVEKQRPVWPWYVAGGGAVVVVFWFLARRRK